MKHNVSLVTLPSAQLPTTAPAAAINAAARVINPAASFVARNWRLMVALAAALVSVVALMADIASGTDTYRYLTAGSALVAVLLIIPAMMPKGGEL